MILYSPKNLFPDTFYHIKSGSLENIFPKYRVLNLSQFCTGTIFLIQIRENLGNIFPAPKIQIKIRQPRRKSQFFCIGIFFRQKHRTEWFMNARKSFLNDHSFSLIFEGKKKKKKLLTAVSAFILIFMSN